MPLLSILDENRGNNSDIFLFGKRCKQFKVHRGSAFFFVLAKSETQESP